MKKRYEEILRDNNFVQNSYALEILLDWGRKNLANDAFVEWLREEIKKEKRLNLLSLDFKMGAVEIAKELASFETKDLCKFIHGYNKILNNGKRER